MTFDCRHPKHHTARKIKFHPQAILTFFTIITISSLLACTPPIPNTDAINSATTQPSATGPVVLASTELTFVAEADAQVNEANPTQNAGHSPFLQVEGSGGPGVESFIRFTVTGISGPVQTALLRVYARISESSNGPAVYATNPSWIENEITWNNRPDRTSEELDNKGSIDTDTWVEYDVTPAVTGDGTFSFVLAADSSDTTTFYSRQGNQPPELVITLADGSTPIVEPPNATPLPPLATSPTSLVFVTEADAQVRQSRPRTNDGTGTTLRVDGENESLYESFIRFTVTGVSGTIQSARLRLYVTDNGTRNGPAVYATVNSWAEGEITWNNRPAPTSEAADNKESLSTESWVEYDVTPLIGGEGTFSFVLVGDGNDAVHFSSREGVQPPQLVLTLGGTSAGMPTVTSSGSADEVVFVGAGDISDCSNDNDELTAQLLDAIPGTVFTSGDNVYESGTYNEYLNCYDPTWGRHKDRTRPVPGNHEYRTDGAAGYFQYFNNVPPYYAYNLGSWRIYALNSEIDVAAGSAQVLWLQTELAANPSQCVLAYWHQPRWSSGRKHGSNPDYQALWQILYEAGAELVINSHEHVYERFAEMDASGAPVSQGLREIIAGTGGKELYEFDTPLPGSEVRDGSTFGVLKLTLRPGSYDWEFIPVGGTSFIDRGTSNCH